jgi:tetratricopeptide (TPR) repeat protein
MGAFFDSIHARTEDVGAVQKALEEVAMRCDAKFLLGPALNGWISILPGGSGPDETLSEEIARQVLCDVFHLAVHDDDISFYFFYRNGKLVDQYNSCPDYVNAATEEEVQKSLGRPELFQDLLRGPSSLEKLKKLLASEKFTFESGRMSDFADLLNLSNALTDYDHIREGKRKHYVRIEFQPQSADDYNKRGEARLAKNNLDGALADFKEALKLNPDLTAASENCGRVDAARNDQKIRLARMYNEFIRQHRKQGNLDEALVHADRAIELFPDYPPAYNNRGLIKKQKGNPDEALADFNKTIELDPKLSAAYVNRGDIKRSDGKFDEALADYDKAIELKPDSGGAYNHRGELKWKKGDAGAALADFDKAIELNPKLGAAYLNRAHIKGGNGSIDEALADYNKAIELKPDSAMAYNNRGELKRKTGNADGALTDYNRAIEIKPESAVFYCNRSMARRMKGDLEGAMADGERAIELKPGLALAYNNRAMIKKDKGDLDGALSDVEKAISLEPKTHGFRTNRDKLMQIKKGHG